MDSSRNKRIINLKLFKHTTKLKEKLKAPFLLTTAELLQQGFSLNQALSFEQLLFPDYQELLDHIIETLSQGDGFETALPKLGYNVSVVAQLFYAQQQGRFIQALHEVGQHLAHRYQLRQKFIRLMIYPFVLLCFLFLLLFGMRAFLLPHLMSFISPEVYNQHGFIRVLIAFFQFLPQIVTSIIACAVVILFGADCYLLRLSPVTKYQLLVRIPLIKKWTQQYCTYKLANELGHFLSSGYSLQQTVHVFIEHPIDPFLTEVSYLIQEAMHQGLSLPDACSQLKIFTPLLPIIMKQGELLSQTAHKCRIYADSLYQEITEDITRKIGYLQPILFLIIAILVMLMYLMMMLPMLTMDQL